VAPVHEPFCQPAAHWTVRVVVAVPATSWMLRFCDRRWHGYLRAVWVT